MAGFQPRSTTAYRRLGTRRCFRLDVLRRARLVRARRAKEDVALRRSCAAARVALGAGAREILFASTKVFIPSKNADARSRLGLVSVYRSANAWQHLPPSETFLSR